MNLTGIGHLARKTLVDNSPGILTGLGVAGLVTTAVLTGKAAIQADRIIRTAYYEQGDDDVEIYTKREIVEMTWKEFIPPAIVGATTIICILGANHVGARRAAAFAAAFKLSEEAAEEYKRKVVEKLGVKAEEGVRAEISKKKMEQAPGHDTIFVLGTKTIFFDEFSGRYFESDYESVRKAVNDINFQINHSMYASVTDFYNQLGLRPTEMSDQFGWNADTQFEVNYLPILIEEGKVAIQLQYRKDPIHGYDRLA